jgi:dihydroorotate dehydrogenase
MMGFTESVQTLKYEELKHGAESTLHLLARNAIGRSLIERASGGKRIEDPRLHTEVGGLELENPLLVGAGWTKDGRAVRGLYELGFAGTEVGSVTVFPQYGNPRPRLFMDKKHAVARNAFGFNCPGMVAVRENLEDQHHGGVIGISLTRNKLTPNSQAAWAHATVADYLYDHADYFAINVASPNTPGLRDLLDPKPLTDIIQAVQDVLREKGNGTMKPLFVKTTVDLSRANLSRVLDTCVDLGANGVIDTNTTIDDRIKAKYGWKDMPGGVSGDDDWFRRRANDRMKFITAETRGTGLGRIGVGAINSGTAAIDRIMAGAECLQIVTAIRQRGPRIAHGINTGLAARIMIDNAAGIRDYIGAAVK